MLLRLLIIFCACMLVIFIFGCCALIYIALRTCITSAREEQQYRRSRQKEM